MFFSLLSPQLKIGVKITTFSGKNQYILPNSGKFF